MNREQHLLVTAAEECAETAQRITKALKFGLTEVQEGQPFNNAQRIIYEFNDLLAMMEMLSDEGYLPAKIRDQHMIDLKKEKFEKYLKYSQSL